MNDQTTAPPEDIDKRVGQFVRLRDLKKEIEDRHKTELSPINNALEELKGLMMAHLQALNVENMKTASGTVSTKVKVSASVADMDAFWTHIVTQGAFELLDKKANVTAVTDYVDKNGVPPPGVNYSKLRDVGVTRARTTK